MKENNEQELSNNTERFTGLFDSDKYEETSVTKEKIPLEKMDADTIYASQIPQTQAKYFENNAATLVDQYVPVTVAQIAGDIKSTLEEKYNYVLVQGEVSNYKKHTSGHHYFSLVDGEATLQCVCWKGTKLPDLVDGMNIICTGRITAYTGRSQFQLVVSAATISGKGNLFKLFEELKNKLEKEGLFAPERKRKLPSMPKHIGIITAATGDALQDILIRLRERVSCRITVWSVQVQGVQAPDMIANAIKGFGEFDKEDRPEILILTRGGGSMEDLWAFNDEITVRAVSNSVIPTVTAIGHEMDITLVDYVSDKRAPTPTASIEMLLPKRSDLEQKILKIAQILNNFSEQTLNANKLTIKAISDNHKNLLEIFCLNKVQRVDYLNERLVNLVTRIVNIQQASLPSIPTLDHLHALFSQKLQSLTVRFNMQDNLSSKEDELDRYSQLLDSFSYERVLNRGFCMASNDSGDIISTAEQAKQEKKFKLLFKDAEIYTSVE